MSILRRIEKTLDERLRGIFGGARDSPGAREAIELYRDALDQIAKRATVGKRGDRVFPFDLIRIELHAEDAGRKALLEALFEAGQVVEDVRAALAEERVSAPVNLTVSVHYATEAAAEMRVLCEKTEQPKTPAAAVSFELTPVRLVTLAGVSSSPDFTVDKARVNIGREEDVMDSLGRAVRRNDLFFPETAHAANASVSRAHAHIGFDHATGEWRIYDDGSSLGTGIFRAGNRIEVPAHAGRGVLLRLNDEITLGQARLRLAAC